MVDTAGDAFFAVFDTPRAAAEAAVTVQRQLDVASCRRAVRCESGSVCMWGMPACSKAAG